MELPPGGTASCYEVLHLSADKPIFAGEGTWKLQAEVPCENTVLRSDPVEITVRKSEKLSAASDVFRARVSTATAAPGSVGEKGVEALRIVDSDADRSRTAATVKRAELFAQLKEANTPAALEAELKVLDRHCDGLNSVEEGFVRLEVMKVLFEKGGRLATAWVDKLDKSHVDFPAYEKGSRTLAREK
jgi:hypothetical protein